MIKNKPLVSVIVPIFNQEKYLEKCLTSIIEQTYSHLEILLINDGSTDNSGKICEKFSKIDYRICIVEKENGGLVSARKKGVYLAKGEYVYFVDADDWIDKNVIEKLWLGGMHKGIDMIGLAGMWKEYRDKTHVKIDLAKLSGIFSTTELEDNHFQWISTDRFYNENVSFSLSMYAIKRKLILPNQMKVDDRIKIGEDFACVWPCLLQAETIAFIKSYGYHYRQTMSSMTQKCKKRKERGLDYGTRCVNENVQVIQHIKTY